MTETLSKTVIDSLPYAILILDEKLRIIMCNESCSTLLLKPKEEILGKELYEVTPNNPLIDHVKRVLQGDSPKFVALRLDMGEDTPKVIGATIRNLEMEGHNFLCQIILEDISERVQLEEQLMQSEKLSGMGFLASIIVHEIGNPLGIMSSTLQYIRDTLSDMGNQTLNKSIENTMTSVSQIHDILQSLSEFYGPRRSHFELADMSYLLSQVLIFISKEAEMCNIKISQQLDENLPRCQINTREVKQLFLNLCKNAIEVMPDGGELHVKMSMTSLDGEDGVQIEISDTGLGINETDLRYIFRPFYSTKPGGMGLGLYFCHRVVEEHGGSITVDSQQGSGSTFIITIPVKQREVEL